MRERETKRESLKLTLNSYLHFGQDVAIKKETIASHIVANIIPYSKLNQLAVTVLLLTSTPIVKINFPLSLQLLAVCYLVINARDDTRRNELFKTLADLNGRNPAEDGIRVVEGSSSIFNTTTSKVEDKARKNGGKKWKFEKFDSEEWEEKQRGISLATFEAQDAFFR